MIKLFKKKHSNGKDCCDIKIVELNNGEGTESCKKGSTESPKKCCNTSN